MTGVPNGILTAPDHSEECFAVFHDLTVLVSWEGNMEDI
jgi:hypothetical protein